MTTTAASPESIEAVIRRLFEENYERLRLEGGHSLSPEAVKEMRANGYFTP